MRLQQPAGLPSRTGAALLALLLQPCMAAWSHTQRQSVRETERQTHAHTHSTLQLSQARSDLGAAAAGGVAVFGGGCARGSSGGGKTGGSCVSPSRSIDILRPAQCVAPSGPSLS